MRLSLADLRSTLLFEITHDNVPAGSESITGGGGSIAWLAARAPAATMLTWDGRRGAAFPLERWAFGYDGFQIEDGPDGRITRVIPTYKPTVLDNFMVSPNGRRVAWDVNLVAGMSPDRSGTIHRRHLVFVADLDGRNETMVLDERYAVPSMFADADETRHLLAWSRVNSDRLYLERLRIGQVTLEQVGPYAYDLRTRSMDTTRAFPAGILALSPDERLLAHTPNDESCCGGINATNNRLLVRELATGRDQVILDEWREFGDSIAVEPGTNGGEDYLPTSAAFSPDGRSLAVTIAHAVDSLASPDRQLTLIRSLAPGDRGRLRTGRVLVGWRDNTQVLLGARRATDSDRGVLDSLFLYDPTRDRETVLPIAGIIPIAVGP
jgi:hypothetical protein